MHVARSLQPFGTSIFAEMTMLANAHKAVNLAQGFPDFDGPAVAKDAAIAAINAGHNQYARMFGAPPLNKAIADLWHRRTGSHVDPETHVTVTSGCTEAIPASLMGVLNAGDEVVMFEPFYDSYRAVVAMVGAVPKVVTLRAPARAGDPFWFDPDELKRAFTDKTRVLLLNTPHNPTGKVFTREELTLIATLCIKHNVIAVSDEVYERLLFDGAKHISIATLPAMADRTITLSSMGKTFSLTGWKIGWAIGHPDLIAGVRAAHQFLSFSVATPLQHAAVAALEREPEALAQLLPLLQEHRDLLADCLTKIGLTIHTPRAGYFIYADHSALSRRLGVTDDTDLCMALIKDPGVAAIPPSAFYTQPADGHSLIRFAFCKKRQTITEAIRRLHTLA
jgi:aspartate/methionine/tyrosine aminotransferase